MAVTVSYSLGRGNRLGLNESGLMKALITTARNIRHIWNDAAKALEPEIEGVLTVYGRDVDFVGAGLSPVEKCETLRFTMSINGARTLADRLNEWATEAETQSSMIEVKYRERNT